MEPTASIEQFHGELQSWKHELSNFKQEIRHFEEQLGKLTGQNLSKELLAQIEHFQNTFICHKEVIDRLRHDLPDSRHKVEHIFHNRHGDHMTQKMEDDLKERMEMFRRVYEEVRSDFRQFEAEWM